MVLRIHSFQSSKNMQTLLLPAASFGVSPATARPYPPNPLYSVTRRMIVWRILASGSSSLAHPQSLTFSSKFSGALGNRGSKVGSRLLASSSDSIASASPNNEVDKAKLAQVTKRLENTSRYFKRLGSLGFWGQLVCTVVAAVILSFSVVVTGKPTSTATFYATSAGIAVAFVSVFWSFGYIRLSERLRKTAKEPSKAPPRADVVKGLKSGIMVNLLGMGAALLGMQATVGFLVAKALTTSANPIYQGISPGYSPVLALDVFLVQASANTILSHFLGLVCSLELLRSVTLPTSEGVPVPKAA